MARLHVVAAREGMHVAGLRRIDFVAAGRDERRRDLIRREAAHALIAAGR